MYLKLTIAKGHGYVSTYDNTDQLLSCKQVSSDEIDKMIHDHSRNENYVVGAEEEQNDDLSFIVEEKSHPGKLIKVQQEAMQQASKKVDDSKQSLEFSRYKQDCRKRALDLAAGEYAEWYRSRSNPKALVPTGQEEKPPNITELADKYYNWLISIPNE